MFRSTSCHLTLVILVFVSFENVDAELNSSETVQPTNKELMQTEQTSANSSEPSDAISSIASTLATISNVSAENTADQDALSSEIITTVESILPEQYPPTNDFHAGYNYESKDEVRISSNEKSFDDFDDSDPVGMNEGVEDAKSGNESDDHLPYSTGDEHFFKDEALEAPIKSEIVPTTNLDQPDSAIANNEPLHGVNSLERNNAVNQDESLPNPTALVDVPEQNLETEFAEALKPQNEIPGKIRRVRPGADQGRRVRMKVRKVQKNSTGIVSPEPPRPRYRSTTTTPVPISSPLTLPPPETAKLRALVESVPYVSVSKETTGPQIERPTENPFTEIVNTFHIPSQVYSSTPIPAVADVRPSAPNNGTNHTSELLQSESTKLKSVLTEDGHVHGKERQSWEKNYMILQQNSFYRSSPEIISGEETLAGLNNNNGGKTRTSPIAASTHSEELRHQSVHRDLKVTTPVPPDSSWEDDLEESEELELIPVPEGDDKHMFDRPRGIGPKTILEQASSSEYPHNHYDRSRHRVTQLPNGQHSSERFNFFRPSPAPDLVLTFHTRQIQPSPVNFIEAGLPDHIGPGDNLVQSQVAAEWHSDHGIHVTTPRAPILPPYQNPGTGNSLDHSLNFPPFRNIPEHNVVEHHIVEHHGNGMKILENITPEADHHPGHLGDRRQLPRDFKKSKQLPVDPQQYRKFQGRPQNSMKSNPDEAPFQLNPQDGFEFQQNTQDSTEPTRLQAKPYDSGQFHEVQPLPVEHTPFQLRPEDPAGHQRSHADPNQLPNQYDYQKLNLDFSHFQLNPSKPSTFQPNHLELGQFIPNDRDDPHHHPEFQNLPLIQNGHQDHAEQLHPNPPHHVQFSLNPSNFAPFPLNSTQFPPYSPSYAQFPNNNQQVISQFPINHSKSAQFSVSPLNSAQFPQSASNPAPFSTSPSNSAWVSQNLPNSGTTSPAAYPQQPSNSDYLQRHQPNPSQSYHDLEKAFYYNLIHSQSSNDAIRPPATSHQSLPFPRNRHSNPRVNQSVSASPTITLPMPGLVSIPTPPPESHALNQVYSNRHYPPHTHSMSVKPDYEPANPPLRIGHPLQHYFDPFIQNAGQYPEDKEKSQYELTAKEPSNEAPQPQHSEKPPRPQKSRRERSRPKQHPPQRPNVAKDANPKQFRSRNFRQRNSPPRRESREYRYRPNTRVPSNLRSSNKPIFSENAHASDPVLYNKGNGKGKPPGGYHRAKVHPREQMLQALASNQQQFKMERHIDKNKQLPLPIHTPYGLLVPMGQPKDATPKPSATAATNFEYEASDSNQAAGHITPADDSGGRETLEDKSTAGEFTDDEIEINIVHHPGDVFTIEKPTIQYQTSYSEQNPVKVDHPKSKNQLRESRSGELKSLVKNVLKEHLEEMLAELVKAERLPSPKIEIIHRIGRINSSTMEAPPIHNFLPPPPSLRQIMMLQRSPPPPKPPLPEGFFGLLGRFFGIGRRPEPQHVNKTRSMPPRPAPPVWPGRGGNEPSKKVTNPEKMSRSEEITSKGKGPLDKILKALFKNTNNKWQAEKRDPFGTTKNKPSAGNRPFVPSRSLEDTDWTPMPFQRLPPTRELRRSDEDQIQAESNSFRKLMVPKSVSSAESTLNLLNTNSLFYPDSSSDNKVNFEFKQKKNSKTVKMS